MRVREWTSVDMFNVLKVVLTAEAAEVVRYREHKGKNQEKAQWTGEIKGAIEGKII